MSTASYINERIAAGTAVVMTLEELCQRPHDAGAPAKADLVAFAFPTGISGSAVMFCVPVAGRGVFTRAEAIFINRLRGHPGPAPNERLGVVDALIFADEQSPGAPYDGAALFLDLLRGRSVEVECLSVEGTTHRNSFVLRDVEFARFYVYDAPLPAGAAKLGILRDTLVPGARAVLNGSQGIVVGPGTRNRLDATTLSITADMHDMDARLMAPGGGRPCHVVAFALPVRDAATVAGLVAWASSAAGEALLCQPALDAAAGLQRMIREGRYLLAETGASGEAEAGR
jgi:L-aspartate semialdehyde sulfurtransferase